MPKHVVYIANKENKSEHQPKWMSMEKSDTKSQINNIKLHYCPTDPEVRVPFPVLTDFLRSLEQLSTIEELIERKISRSGLESFEYGRRDPRSVSIIRSWTQATELFVFLFDCSFSGSQDVTHQQ
jgi:hypothetical protein